MGQTSGWLQVRGDDPIAEGPPQVSPVLEEQGENVFYLGALGAGHVTKLINNFMGMTTVCTQSGAPLPPGPSCL